MPFMLKVILQDLLCSMVLVLAEGLREVLLYLIYWT